MGPLRVRPGGSSGYRGHVRPQAPLLPLCFPDMREGFSPPNVPTMLGCLALPRATTSQLPTDQENQELGFLLGTFRTWPLLETMLLGSWQPRTAWGPPHSGLPTGQALPAHLGPHCPSCLSC